MLRSEEETNPMKHIILYLSSILLALLCSAHSYSYELLTSRSVVNNQHVWYVHLPGNTEDGHSYIDLFSRATSLWMTTAPQLDLSFIQDEQEVCNGDTSINGINTVSFRSSYCDETQPSFSGYAPYHSTVVSHDDGSYDRYIDEGDIFLVPWPNTYVPRPRTSPETLGTLNHEIGHNLGLAHSVVFASIMNPAGGGRQGISPDDACAIAIVTGYPDRCPIALTPSYATDASHTSAHFAGYASESPKYSIINGVATPIPGFTPREVFRPNEELIVYATVLYDKKHWRKPGAIHILAQLSDGPLYAKQEDGSWTPYLGGEVPVSIKSPNLYLADDFIIVGRDPSTVLYGGQPFHGAQLGLEGQTLLFWIAYSVDDQPGVYIHGGEPIRISWTLD